MYGTYVLGNDAARLELQQMYDKAEQRWRFRHVGSRGHQVLAAVLKRALEFAQKALRGQRTPSTVAQVREQASC